MVLKVFSPLYIVLKLIFLLFSLNQSSLKISYLTETIIVTTKNEDGQFLPQSLHFSWLRRIKFIASFPYREKGKTSTPLVKPSQKLSPRGPDRSGSPKTK